MEKQYELWLDESGRFAGEKLLKQRGYKPSLIGGLLLEKEAAGRVAFDELVDENRNHAMELTNLDKREYILPALEMMKEKYHAKEVFFENAEYEEESSNRQLYLRIMAEGLLQLMQTLNAEHDSVVLEVLIAQRQDVSASYGRQRIEKREYISALKKCIELKKKEHKILLNEDSRLKFDVKIANREKKLQLADFACNTRLTRDSKAFSQVKSRVAALYLDAYVFTLTEVSSENFIKRSLSQGYFSDAIMELYTTRDKLDYEKMLSRIMKRMQETKYRLVKAQLKQCASDIVAYAAKEDDFEIGEKFLIRLKQELIPALKEYNQPYRNLQFTLLIQLSDMFLREGAILEARAVLQECRHAQESLGNGLEEVFSYYQLLEKEALLAVDEFDYKKGAEIMGEACAGFQTILDAVAYDRNLKKRFANIKSEYFGDALCMQIYAMMFQQRHQPELYGKLCELSNLALSQYPDVEEELERNRQYRSHIELEHGDFAEALNWLFLAGAYKTETFTNETIQKFLQMICEKEDAGSCQYYLMYYLIIMSAAKKAGDSLADKMYEALLQQKTLMLSTGLIKEPISEEGLHEVDMNEVQEEDSGISYHPSEILNWKYGTYLFECGRMHEALHYYRKAVNICFKYEQYQTMYITGIGIAADKICCLYAMKQYDVAQNEYRYLLEKIERLLNQALSDVTRMFVLELKRLLVGSRSPEGIFDKELLQQISGKITY